MMQIFTYTWEPYLHAIEPKCTWKLYICLSVSCTSYLCIYMKTLHLISLESSVWNWELHILESPTVFESPTCTLELLFLHVFESPVCKSWEPCMYLRALHVLRSHKCMYWEPYMYLSTWHILWSHLCAWESYIH